LIHVGTSRSIWQSKRPPRFKAVFVNETILEAPLQRVNQGPQPIDSTICASVAARLVKIIPRRLRQLVGEGWIPMAAYGRFAVVGVVHGCLSYRDDVEQRHSAAASDNDLRAVRRREIEQRMAIRDRELIGIVEHDAVFDEAFGMIEGGSRRPVGPNSSLGKARGPARSNL
jgi:hypothetical protein